MHVTLFVSVNCEMPSYKVRGKSGVNVKASGFDRSKNESAIPRAFFNHRIVRLSSDKLWITNFTEAPGGARSETQKTRKLSYESFSI